MFVFKTVRTSDQPEVKSTDKERERLTFSCEVYSNLMRSNEMELNFWLLPNTYKSKVVHFKSDHKAGSLRYNFVNYENIKWKHSNLI